MAMTLIGYRGTGKSTVAARLADRLGWTWIDVDAEIEKRAGKTIRAIFADAGEPAFRQLEQTVMADLLEQSQLVIAAGGGAVTSAATRDLLMSPEQTVIWLSASVETIRKRIHLDPTTAERRPDLTTLDQRTEIETLLAERTPYYQQCANITVDTDKHSIDELVATIISQLPENIQRGAAGQ